MAARFFLCVVLLVAVSLLLSGCGGGSGSGGGKSGCDWKFDKFEKISKMAVAAEEPMISSDGKAVTCKAEEACAATGALTPLKPGDHPHELDEAVCNGTYSFSLKVQECGTGSGKVGWHTDSLEYSFSSMGVDISGLGSCAEVGWKCGCSGSVDGGLTTKKVTGNLTLEVTMDTTKWPWYQVRFVAPPGATGSKGTQQEALVEPKVAMDNIDQRSLSRFHPFFMLGPGAVFSLSEKSSTSSGEPLIGNPSSPDSGRLARKSGSSGQDLEAPNKPALVV